MRVHWWMSDDRPVCLYEAPARRLSAGQYQETPFCGACVLVLSALGVRPERMFELTAEPDLRPGEARELLRDTSWESVVDLDREVATNWWFEREAM